MVRPLRRMELYAMVNCPSLIRWIFARIRKTYAVHSKHRVWKKTEYKDRDYHKTPMRVWMNNKRSKKMVVTIGYRGLCK